MGLDKIFQKQEKIEEEKKLGVITTKESAVDDLTLHLINFFKKDEEKYEITSWWNVFDYYKRYLQKLEITPSIIQKVSGQLSTSESTEHVYRTYKGIALTALMQQSYNCGFNNFEFEDVVANGFCEFLKGEDNSLVKIKANKIIGNSTLASAEYCTLKTASIEGWQTLWLGENCTVEIGKYNGYQFGYKMKNCKIHVSNEKVLEEIRKTACLEENGANNTFVIKQ